MKGEKKWSLGGHGGCYVGYMDLQMTSRGRCGRGCTAPRDLCLVLRGKRCQERESRLEIQIWEIWAQRKQKQVDSIIRSQVNQQSRTKMESMALPTIKGQVWKEE